MYINRYPRPLSEDYLIDFETPYDSETGFSVKDLGNVAYAKDPRCIPYMVSITRIDEKCETLFVGPPEEFNWASILDGNWWAFNAGFEAAIYEYGMQNIPNCPPLPQPPRPFDDAAGLAAFNSYPRALNYMVKEFTGVEADKSQRANADGKRGREDFTDVEWQAMLKYCAQDGLDAGAFVFEYAGSWPEIERDLAVQAYEKANKGVCINFDLLEWGIAKLDSVTIECESEMPWVTQYDLKPLSKKGLALVCRDHGIDAPASIAEGCEELEAWMEKYADNYDFVNSMKRWTSANTLQKKLKVFQTRKTDLPRVAYGIKYYGAHTGRYAGDAKTNVQALNAEEVEGVAIREMIEAPEGFIFMIPDFSQIEPRCLAHLSGNTRFLKIMQEGFSPYEAHAIDSMGWVKKGTARLKEENPGLYKLAKARILALGYGCGGPKFVVMAKKVADLVISLPDAKKCVDDFRASNPLLCDRQSGFWAKLERTLQRTAIRPKDQRNCHILLPSGRKQSYLNVQTRSGKVFAQTERGKYHTSLYGGKLCENVTQAVARDVLVEAMVRLDNAGWGDIAFTVHDELILEVPEWVQNSPATIKEIRDLLTVTPDWLPGCPIECEWKFSKHYLK